MTQQRPTLKPTVGKGSASLAGDNSALIVQPGSKELLLLNCVRPISPPIISQPYMSRPLLYAPSAPLRFATKRRSDSEVESAPQKTRVVSNVPRDSQPVQRALLGVQRVGPDGQLYIEIVRPLNSVAEEKPIESQKIEDAYFVTTEDSSDGRESVASASSGCSRRASNCSLPKCSLFCYLFRIVCRCFGGHSFTYGKVVQEFIAHTKIQHYPLGAIENVKNNLLQILLTDGCFEFAGSQDDEDEDVDEFDFSSSHMNFSWKLASNLDYSTISTAVANDSSHKCPTADRLLGKNLGGPSEDEDEEEQPVMLADLLQSF